MGFLVNQDIHFSNSSESACAEKLFILETFALTAISSHIILTIFSHSKICLHKVHSAWYHIKSIVFFGSRNQCFK